MLDGGKMNIKVENGALSVREESSSLQTSDWKAVVKVENESPTEEHTIETDNLADFFERETGLIRGIKTERDNLLSVENPSSVVGLLSCASSSFAGESNILIKKEEDIDTDEEVFQAIIKSNYKPSLESENHTRCDETNEPRTSYDEANSSNKHRWNETDCSITMSIDVEDKDICESQRSRAYYYSNGFKLAHVSVILKDLKYYPITNIVKKQFVCAYCLDKFKYKCNLKAHISIHTNEKPFLCTACPARFSRRSHLKIHMTTHTGEKPFLCTLCPAKFSQSGHLKNHMTTHTGEKPFLCTLCPAKFSQSGHLKRHMTTHTGEKPFFCTVCPAEFTRSSSLKYHLTTHTGEKSFLCTLCPAKFAHRGTLKIHLNTHTGVKPFPCTICSAKFSQRHHLKSHLITHTGEKPFVCTLCPAKFAYSSTFKNHMTAHTNEKCFRCAHCLAVFNRKYDLKRHMDDHSLEK